MTREKHVQACADECVMGRDWHGAPDIVVIDEYVNGYGIDFTREEMIAIVTEANRQCLERAPTEAGGPGAFTQEVAQRCIDQLIETLNARGR